MKLSEAIRMNGMMKPQGFGDQSIASLDAPCAIGGALQSIGIQDPRGASNNYGLATFAWPWLNRKLDCPFCNVFKGHRIVSVLYHLNDNHRWTRSQIADWVETVEPKETPQTQEAVHEQVLI
jgi:hypothetical protein